MMACFFVIPSRCPRPFFCGLQPLVHSKSVSCKTHSQRFNSQQSSQRSTVNRQRPAVNGRSLTAHGYAFTANGPRLMVASLTVNGQRGFSSLDDHDLLAPPVTHGLLQEACLESALGGHGHLFFLHRVHRRERRRLHCDHHETFPTKHQTKMHGVRSSITWGMQQKR